MLEIAFGSHDKVSVRLQKNLKRSVIFHRPFFRLVSNAAAGL